ncbi:RsmE family RNA methyltransferase [Mycoplasmopsis californica]|uniref:Ribosomal RNA small subunit methyltransferase E n=1 Tax=Mycoplasmopsis equigenitalium TaxID=114883 RepID=A0ABY5J3N2_9BACT|nr:RsmE family RNA methyltransferase [Mycoplasmopsis equigenitalium]UUD36757.1 16S rRNA (uracil(1498)-N(3))-methyltransferase [Mycoplasmopsis equigenitalium]VEU69948.1 RsmE family RNA methyltransferase [Mycoplasmopsis californica]
MRYIVNEKNDEFFIFDKETLNHLKVNRIRDNEEIHCLYKNEYYLCKYVKGKAKIIEKTSINNEFNHDIVVGLPLIKYKKIDLLVQKLTELGVKKLQLLTSENIAVKWNEKDLTNKIERWTTISKAACEQSFRNNCLEINLPVPFDQFVTKFEGYNKFIAHEKTSTENTKTLFIGNLVFLVGPEGGFSDKEVEFAKANNYEVISLGKRILRAETSVLKLVSNISDNN